MPANVAGVVMLLALDSIQVAMDDVARVSSPIGMWLTLIRDIGLLATACAFFVWASWIRENKQHARIVQLDTFIHDRMLAMLENSTKTIDACSEALRMQSDAMRKLLECSEDTCETVKRMVAILENRPCLMDNQVVERISDIVQKIQREKR